jgi:serine/threonine-protein kinase RsbW
MAGSGDAVSKGPEELPFPVAEFDHDKLQIVANVTLHADVNEITPFVENLMKMISQMECAHGKEYEIELALREALANAIVHGCKNDCTQKVQCCVACDLDRGMLIVVRNPGNGFDVDSVPNPTMGDNVFSNHGRGIYMINQLMDEVKWMKNGTEIHMVKY